MPLEEVVLDHQVIGETMSPEGAARQRVVVVAAREAMIARVIEAVQGRRPEGRGDRPRRLRPRPRAGHRLRAGRLGPRLLPPGRHHQPGDRARLELPLHAPAVDRLGRPGRGVANALAEEIRLSIDFYMAQPEARWVGEVVLSGPGSRRDGLVDELSGLLQLPVSIAEPLGNLDAAAPADGRGPVPPHGGRRPGDGGRRHEARQPSSAEAPPAPAERRQARAARTSCSASSACFLVAVVTYVIESNKITQAQERHRHRRAEDRRGARHARSSSARSATSPRSRSSASRRSRQLADGRFDWERTRARARPRPARRASGCATSTRPSPGAAGGRDGRRHARPPGPARRSSFTAARRSSRRSPSCSCACARCRASTTSS